MRFESRATAEEAAMLFRALILYGIAALLLTMSLPGKVRANDTADREHRLKAAFLYNFMMFVNGERFQWDAEGEEAPDPNQPIQIGIVGRNPFGDAFEPLKDKTIRNRRVAIKSFKGFSELINEDGNLPEAHPQLEAMRRCHVLFVCPSEQAYVDAILGPIRTLDILTVGETPGFLEAGGIVRFIIEDKKLRFAVNLAAATRAKLQVRSKLLRLAKRIITHDAFEKPNDEGESRQSGEK
jgi:hypothetical protein